MDCLKRLYNLRQPSNLLACVGVYGLACGLGTGFFPKAPGTVGTLLAVPLYIYGLQPLPWLVRCIIVFVLFMMGIGLCQWASRYLGQQDHPAIVWDEIVGYTLTMLFLPSGGWWWLVGFVAFRLFDIWKPWPIRQIDSKCHGGWGVMLDDIVAGVYASCLCLIINKFAS